MPFDYETAKQKTEEFYAYLQELKHDFPEAVESLEREWKQLYGTAGHKRLGRIIMGMTAEQACRGRGE